MKIRNTAVLLMALLVTALAFAQTSAPPTAPATPVPPVSRTPPVPPEPVSAPPPGVAEGVLMKSARANNDNGK